MCGGLQSHNRISASGMALMEVRHTFITISRPMRDGDTGKIEEGCYTLEGDTVTLTDQEGKPLVSGRLQTGYAGKIGPGETPEHAASRLLWRKYRATKGGSDFNRPLVFPKEGWR
jgi:hypothetical protein